MAATLTTILYETDGAVATITMNRPEMANAQDTTLIDELDAAFDLADADDAMRVVILAGAGSTSPPVTTSRPSSGTASRTTGSQMRETPEGKFFHEKTMYYDRCLRIHDFRKPTIAAVQGSCVAAGLMLAAMCDLIVAADDAMFSNPVLRLTGAGVELLVEPWELGIRKAKEFLLTGDTIDAQEAWRLGLVNRVVPRAELMARTTELADRIALVPPITAQTVKDTINHTGTLMGKQDALKYHFMAHHWVHNTATALERLGPARQKGSDEGGLRRARQGRPGLATPLSGTARRRPGHRRRHPDLGPVLRRPAWASWAPTSSRWSCPAGRLHAHHGSLHRRGGRAGLLLVLGGGRAGPARASPATCATPRARNSSSGLAATADVLCENFRPGTMEKWGLGPDDLDPSLVYVRISVFGQTGPYSPRPGLDRLGIAFGGLLHLTGDPDRPPVRPGVTVSDYLTGVFAAFAAVSALYGRDRDDRGRRRRVIDAPLYGAILRILEWTLAGYDRLGIVRQREGNRLSTLGPARQLPDRRRLLRLHRGRLRRQLLPPVPGHGSSRPGRRPPLRHPGRTGRPG